jgi:hypothetical protein
MKTNEGFEMKTDEMMIVIDSAAATFFALMGSSAAVCAIAFGAPWHLFTAAICGVMVWANVRELVKLIGKRRGRHVPIQDSRFKDSGNGNGRRRGGAERQYDGEAGEVQCPVKSGRGGTVPQYDGRAGKREGLSDGSDTEGIYG